MAKISTNWLNDYIDISDEDLTLLATKITNAGVNIETIEKYNDENLVVGQVIDVKKHPNSDHLNLCSVDVGEGEILKIVCGAPNVEKNMKVIVSKVGCILPNGVEIRKSTIRGEESEGMLCALMELNLEEDTEENYKKGIYKLPDNALVGANPYIYLGLDDTVYNLDLNPNRVADCTNHIGFSYETAAILNKKVELPETKSHELDRSVANELSLDVITNDCPMYLARKVVNVEIKPSPKFIKERLEAVGIRSINNVVDISNYIMLEYGQPLHFFDADKLGDSIIVRNAQKGETTVTLDGEKYKLDENDIVVANKTDICAIAGIMGCANTMVDENTKDIIIESAIFEPLKIRTTSKKVGIRTESSTRFEYGLNYEYTHLAIDRACYLLEKYAKAEVLSGLVSFDSIERKEKEATVTLENINSLFDLEMTVDDVKDSLNRLDFGYDEHDGTFDVIIPNRRGDVSIKEDLIEEIGRLYGYEKIKSKLPNLPIRKGQYKGNISLRKSISKRLRSLGLNETRTYTLISEEMDKQFHYDRKESIKLLKPMSSAKSIIRQSLIPSLLSVYEYNVNRGMKDINIYEISNIYYDTDKEETKVAILLSGSYIENKWQNLNIESSFYVLKGIIDNLLNYLGYSSRVTYEKAEDIGDMHKAATAYIKIDNSIVGFLGKVSPLITKNNIFVAEISLNKLIEKKVRPYKYKEINKYPQITKDVSFVISNDLTSFDIEKEIRRSGGKLLTDVMPFDVYEDKSLKDSKSITYKLTFEDTTKTLTSEEVNELFMKIIDEVSKKLNIHIRE